MTTPTGSKTENVAVEQKTMTGRALWAVLALVLLADALDMIDSTVTNIAAPTIAAHIGGGQGLITWLGTSYMLAMGVLLVLGGRLGDRFGQRRLLLIGMTGFTAASALAGLAVAPWMMLTARVAQGAFGALMIPQGMAIMTRIFPKDMLTKAFGLFGPLLGVASVGGPVLAGVIIDADLFGLSWRPVFLVNLVLGVLGLITATRILPKDDGDRSVGVDGIGSVLLAVMMGGLLYGLVEGSSNGWTALPLTCLAVGVVFALAFARRQVTAREPLLKPSLLANPGFTSGLLVGLVVFAATTGLVYVVSLFLQTALGASPRQAALALLPMTLGIMVAAGAAMAGLVARLGRALVWAGVLILVAGAALTLVQVNSGGTGLSVWALSPAVFVIGLGMGACYATIFDVALGDIAADEAGSASGSLSSIQQLASGIGSAAVTSVFFRTTSGGLDHAMTVSLVVVLVLLVLPLPLVTLMPRKAPEESPGH